MADLLPPMPVGVPPDHSYWNDWYERLRSLVNGVTSGIANIIGGTIDGAVIGGTNPAAGTFTTMTTPKAVVDQIDFNTSAGVAVLPGQMAWNAGDGCVDIGMGYDSVVLQTGMEMLYRIKASAAITNGQLVMFDGSVGASGVLKGKPSITGLPTGQLVMGVATMDIANNAFGYVTAFGLVRGINTTGASVGETWADGDILYYNPAYVGSMTNVQPAAPNDKVVVAAVVNASSGGSGSLFIRTSFLPHLGDLSDVYIPTPSNGDLLQWKSSTNRWESVPSSSLNGSVPVTKTANFTVGVTDNWLINNKSGSTCTVTLPSAASFPGRELTFHNYQDQLLISASSNVVPRGGGSAGTAILDAVSGNWATLVSDGTNWLIMQAAANNCLLI